MSNVVYGYSDIYMETVQRVDCTQSTQMVNKYLLTIIS